MKELLAPFFFLTLKVLDEIVADVSLIFFKFFRESKAWVLDTSRGCKIHLFKF